MDIILFFAVGVSFVIFICIPYLGYLLPNRYGYRKIGIALGSTLAVFVMHIIYPEPLQKLFFTKNDARELLALQDLRTQHEFQVTENEYNQWDWPSQRLVLNIDLQDKALLTEQIRSSLKFIKKGDSIPDIKLADRYFGNAEIIRYETQNALICKSLIPAQEDNYAPMWLMTSVSKTENRLEVVKWYDD
ncbi:hypothetical protein [Dyadobacter sp. CY343]|uniref:hypothetical protein n=1 Tax=Dyadobacter sp. CY343 TaxID=2907299 RepID=UPI001F4464E8|nr:hypothetical protein [Dyadobacter sp. CY343]MCE7061976.1 hypothetical protein [Dyadobacter sp. CY343]